MKYEITIKEITEVEEVVDLWINPKTKEKADSSYAFDEEDRKSLVHSKRGTGRILKEENLIYKQEVEDINLSKLITIINT